MNSLRIMHHPVLGPPPDRKPVSFRFEDRPYTGFQGEPVAAALLAEGVLTLRRHEASGAPRGIYCAIGHCMECRVRIEGAGIVRACITPLEEGLRVYRPAQPDQPIVTEDSI